MKTRLFPTFTSLNPPRLTVIPTQPRFGQDSPEPQGGASEHLSRKQLLGKSLKNALMIPVLPLVGYFTLDATGVTDMIGEQSEMMKRILGEGFGHAGLCFSIHYVINASKSFYKALTLRPRIPRTEDPPQEKV